MNIDPLTEQIGEATNLLGLLLVLITLFTSEQSRRLSEERKRSGGADTNSLHQIRVISVGLTVVTGASVLALSPLTGEVVRKALSANFEPIWLIFALAWALLVALVVWQVALVVGARG